MKMNIKQLFKCQMSTYPKTSLLRSNTLEEFDLKITFENGSTKQLSFVQVQSLEYRNVRNASIAIIITWTTIGAVSTPIWIQHRLQVVPILQTNKENICQPFNNYLERIPYINQRKCRLHLILILVTILKNYSHSHKISDNRRYMQLKTLHSKLQLKAFPTNNNKSPPILGFTKPPFPPK